MDIAPLSTTDVITERPTDFKSEEGDHDKEAHLVVPGHKATEAMVTGIPCTALCGKTWVPTRSPDPFPVCKLCIETWEKVTGKLWTGRR